MSWHILGAGALGCLWAARLAEAGQPVSLILRSRPRLDAFTRAGSLTLIRNGETRAVPLAGQLADAAEPIERLLVTCKAYDAASAVTSVAHRLAPSSTVLLLQNGLGSQAAVMARTRARCLFVSSTEGAYLRADFQVVHAGLGQNWIGDPAGNPPPAWLAELDSAGIPFAWSDDILMRLWRKLALNCAINPLTVLHQCRNGRLSDYRVEVDGLCDELVLVLRAAGQAGAAQQLHSEVWRVIEATSSNFSSMYQDVSRGRRTEVTYLLGHILREAGQHRLEVPRLMRLHAGLEAALRAHGLPSD